MFDYGLSLKQLRVEAQYTQKQLAKIMNVSENTIIRWENNYKLPNIDNLIALSALYGVTLNYIAGIDRNRKIVLNRLPEKQKELLHILLNLLESYRIEERDTPFSKRQQEALSLLIQAFKQGV